MKPNEDRLRETVEACWNAVRKAKLDGIADPANDGAIRLQSYYIVLQSTLLPRRIQHEQIGSVRYETVDPDANADWRK